MLIQAVPALPRGVGDALLLEESLDGLQLRLLRVKADAVGSILQQVGDGLVGITLGVADQADRAAADPAGGVHARQALALLGLRVGGTRNARDAIGGRPLGEHATTDVRQHVLTLIPRQARLLVGLVAHGAVDRADRPLGELAGARDRAIAIELGSFGDECGHAAFGVSLNLNRGLEEVDVQLVRSALRVGDGVLLQAGADHVLNLGRAAGLLGTLVVLDVLRVDNDLDRVGIVELLQLQRGELSLRRATAAEDVDLLGLVLLQGIINIVRDLGDLQLLAGLGQHAGDVQADVAHADDGDGVRGQIPLVLEVRVGIVEADELAGADGVLAAGDVQRTVIGGARGVDNRIVELLELVNGDVLADVDVAEQADLRLVHHLVEGLDDALNTRVVGGNAVADQAEGGRHALVNVDADVGLRLRQRVGGVDACRAGADDCNAKWAILGHVRCKSFLFGLYFGYWVNRGVELARCVLLLLRVNRMKRSSCS